MKHNIQSSHIERDSTKQHPARQSTFINGKIKHGSLKNTKKPNELEFKLEKEPSVWCVYVLREKVEVKVNLM